MEKCPDHDGCFKELQQGLNRIALEVEEIKKCNKTLNDALLGTLDKEGLVAKIMKADEHRIQCEAKWDDFHELIEFRKGTVKALWIIYTATVGLIIKTIFYTR